MENNICYFKKDANKNYCHICNIMFGAAEPRIIIAKINSNIVSQNGYYTMTKIWRHVSFHQHCYRKKFNFHGKFEEITDPKKGFKILKPIL